jgi:ATP/maltotriose-dependent transcriptional regulator MalT/DNA-binding SARP family transcriptional activator
MANFIPVTRTKVSVPRRRAELLSRTRLLGLFEELLDNRLVILAAPAGYGKTSLLVDFASTTQWPVCWYALDNLDQDPLRFIAHFIASLQARFPKFGESCMAALQSMGQDQLDTDVMVSLIVNDAYDTIPEHFILVLDDFHLVENSRSVVNFVNRFIQDADENVHLVLASRSLLTLPDLTLMVARSQVGGLSFEELCFQQEEIQRLLEQNYRLTISDAEAAELARETEGWITGLLLSTQLMGRTMANQLRVARVSGVGLYEYLAQQVLELQNEPVQVFLLRSSLMDEFDQAACEEVIGDALAVQCNWRELMDAVLRLNLFVLPVGDDGQFLRYHHLFLDFLRDRVRRERPAEARKIQMRLADVFAARQDWERAYHIYQSLGDTGAVVQLLESAGGTIIAQGQLISLSNWLAALPEELREKHASLLSLQGAVSHLRGESQQGFKLLNRAVEGLTRDGNNAALAQALCRRSGSFRFLGKYQEAYADAESAFNLVSAETPRSSLYADALTMKGSTLGYLGQINEALGVLKLALEVYQELGDQVTAAKVLMEIGRLAKRLGHTVETVDAYHRALAIFRETGNLIWQANLYNNLGVLQHATGDYVTATSNFERAIHYAKMGGAPRLEAYALTSIGDLYQELDAVRETLEAYRQAREVALRVQDGFLLVYLNLVEARLKLTHGEMEPARLLLEATQPMADQRGSVYEQHLCRIEWGRTALIDRHFAAADVAFQEALAFFTEHEMITELPRVWLYAQASRWLCREESDPALNALLLTALDAPEQRRQLIQAGREVIATLALAGAEGARKALPAALLTQVEDYSNSISSARRLVRRHAGVVPFAPPKMIIRTMGKVQVKVADRVITSSDWQVQTARDLFLLLLAHPEGLTKEAIGEIFWPDSTISELKLRFKNTIYRLRHGAGKDAILFEGESRYLFNRTMDYEYDVESYLKEISLAERADTTEKRVAHYQNALRLYRGDYLPDLDESWVIAERERLFQSYIDVLLKLANMAMNNQKYEEALEICQKALKADSCQEDVHRLAMRIYAAMGNRALLIRQYDQCRQALLEEVDAEPSYQTQALYQSLIQ